MLDRCSCGRVTIDKRLKSPVAVDRTKPPCRSLLTVMQAMAMRQLRFIFTANERTCLKGIGSMQLAG